jgi:MFS family permease
LQTQTTYIPTVAETFQHETAIRVKLWMLCFLYSVAGLGIISLMSPLMQNVMRTSDSTLGTAELAAAGATLIAAASVGNSVGRLFWAWLSDIVGRVEAFILLLSTSAIAFVALPYITSPLLFGILISYTIASMVAVSVPYPRLSVICLVPNACQHSMVWCLLVGPLPGY